MAEQKLTYTLERRGDHCLMRLAGSAGYSEAAVLDKCLEELQAQSPKAVVCDLAKVDYIGSAAIGALVRLHKWLEARQGQLRLAALSPQVQEVFTLSALEKVFRTFPDAESALA
jgi:anti-sigma B factor antagonist